MVEKMSAHHYFRDFSYCDSGIIPWLLVWEYLSTSKLSLSELILEHKNCFPSSGELNFKVPNAATCIEKFKITLYQRQHQSTSWMACLCLLTWRFNSASLIQNHLSALTLRQEEIKSYSKKK